MKPAGARALEVESHIFSGFGCRLVHPYRSGAHRNGTLDMLVQAGALDLKFENSRALRLVLKPGGARALRLWR